MSVMDKIINAMKFNDEDDYDDDEEYEDEEDYYGDEAPAAQPPEPARPSRSVQPAANLKEPDPCPLADKQRKRDSACQTLW